MQRRLGGMHGSAHGRLLLSQGGAALQACPSSQRCYPVLQSVGLAAQQRRLLSSHLSATPTPIRRRSCPSMNQACANWPPASLAPCCADKASRGIYDGCVRTEEDGGDCRATQC